MKSPREAARWCRERGSEFWTAATVAVPVLLSTALVLVLVLEMAVAALDVRVEVARLIAVAIVELVFVSGFIWSAGRPGSWPAGVGVAGAIVGVIVFAAATATL